MPVQTQLHAVTSGYQGSHHLPELPRVLQIEVGRVLAHLCDEQLRGGLGDGVDAGDVGW
ncbi:hypothetical protein [Corynebacterium sp. H78]|uniref:hypothetical protein n=1 Tax=Corynebacterium sp. H78 TaxID=3133417 RepID=UPI0030B42ABA